MKGGKFIDVSQDKEVKLGRRDYLEDEVPVWIRCVFHKRYSPFQLTCDLRSPEVFRWNQLFTRPCCTMLPARLIV